MLDTNSLINGINASGNSEYLHMKPYWDSLVRIPNVNSNVYNYSMPAFSSTMTPSYSMPSASLFNNNNGYGNTLNVYQQSGPTQNDRIMQGMGVASNLVGAIGSFMQIGNMSKVQKFNQIIQYQMFEQQQQQQMQQMQRQQTMSCMQMVMMMQMLSKSDLFGKPQTV